MKQQGTSSKGSGGRGRTNSLPSHVVDYLKAWILSPEHIHHPYPTEQEKEQMMADTGIDLKKLNNWFVNNRIRFWKPRMEAMQKQGGASMVPGSPATPKNPSATSSPPTRSLSSRGLPPRKATIRPKDPSELYEVLDDALNKATGTPYLSRSSRTVSDASLSASEASSIVEDSEEGSVVAATASSPPRKRGRSDSLIEESVLVTPPPRKKRTIPAPLVPRSEFAKQDVNLWRSVCLASPQIEHECLPTLDEAALLFGLAQEKSIAQI